MFRNNNIRRQIIQFYFIILVNSLLIDNDDESDPGYFFEFSTNKNQVIEKEEKTLSIICLLCSIFERHFFVNYRAFASYSQHTNFRLMIFWFSIQGTPEKNE